MAILAECPTCHRKQAVKNRICACGEDLIKAKKRKDRVRYWISYRLPNGKQRREFAGCKVEEANAAHGKRGAQRYENPSILEKMPAEKMTFSELESWYLALPSVANLSSYQRVKQAMANFTNEYGNRIVSTLKPIDIESYQQKRLNDDGMAPATVDMETSIVKTMVTKAFDNDIVDGRTVKAFRKIRRQLKKAGNARRQILGISDYVKILQCPNTPSHLRDILIVAYNTGMRLGELRGLKWSYIDKGMIRLPAELTKESRTKMIPINHHVQKVFDAIRNMKVVHHEYVFTYHNKPINGKVGLKKSFRSACKEAGLQYGRDISGGIIFHDIRRTFKTNLLNAGVDKVHRDLIVGHSLQGMDAHYMSPSEDDLHHAMARYTSWLDSQVKNNQSDNPWKIVDQNVDQVCILKG